MSTRKLKCKQHEVDARHVKAYSRRLLIYCPTCLHAVLFDIRASTAPDENVNNFIKEKLQTLLVSHPTQIRSLESGARLVF